MNFKKIVNILGFYFDENGVFKKMLTSKADYNKRNSYVYYILVLCIF